MSEQLDMSPEELERAGARAFEWIADYLARPEAHPVLSRVRPGELKEALPRSAPRDGEPIEAILDDFERLIVPGITHWNHPGFLAYFAITGSGPGILGELLSAALNINAMLWQTSPAATELEEVALDWLRQMIGLEQGFKGVIVDTASLGTVCSIAAARHALSELAIRDRGLAGRSDVPRLLLYTSEQAHSSVEKAAIVLGIGSENVRKLPTDDDFRMSVPALETAIERDRAAGGRPFCVVATVGTTSTSSIDPVPQIAEICEREGLWLHVDAAYAGSAAIVPEYRHVLDGCDSANSIIVNPHKWLFTPIDCSALYVRDADQFTDAFSLVPEYLHTGVDGDVTNYMDWGIALGRRFRALKLWMVLRYFGSAGIARHIARHIELAQRFAGWVDDDREFERLAPAPLSLVCFRARPTQLVQAAKRSGRTEDELESALDRFNETLLGRVNESGTIYISRTRLRGRFTLRLAVGNLRTTEKHVAGAWQLLQAEVARLLDNGAAAWLSNDEQGISI